MNIILNILFFPDCSYKAISIHNSCPYALKIKLICNLEIILKYLIVYTLLCNGLI